jgi:hypothetical protein
MSNVHEITIRKPPVKFYDTLVVRLFEAMDVELHLKSITKKLGHVLQTVKTIACQENLLLRDRQW